MSTLPSTPLGRLLFRAVTNVHLKVESLRQVSTDDLVELASRGHAVAMAAKDLRTLATAIAHGIVEPRPDLGALAAVQAVTASGLRRRYPAQLLKPLTQLACDHDVNAAQLFDAFESLTASDLLGVSAKLDQAIETTFGRIPPSSLVKREISKNIVDDLPRLSELVNNPSWELASTENREPRNRRKALAFQLVGEALVNLSGSVRDVNFRGWTGLGGTTSSIEWEAGPSIDQVLAVLLPMKLDGILAHGIRGLKLERSDASMAHLIWTYDSSNVKLRLIRA